MTVTPWLAPTAGRWSDASCDTCVQALPVVGNRTLPMAISFDMRDIKRNFVVSRLVSAASDPRRLYELGVKAEHGVEAGAE